MRLILAGVFLLCFIAFSGCGGNKRNAPEANSKAVKTDSTVATITTNPLKDCYFGDLHLHTALSPDANVFGATLMPEDSYKYALGEEVVYMGQKVKRIAPL